MESYTSLDFLIMKLDGLKIEIKNIVLSLKY